MIGLDIPAVPPQSGLLFKLVQTNLSREERQRMFPRVSLARLKVAIAGMLRISAIERGHRIHPTGATLCFRSVDHFTQNVFEPVCNCVHPMGVTLPFCPVRQFAQNILAPVCESCAEILGMNLYPDVALTYSGGADDLQFYQLAFLPASRTFFLFLNWHSWLPESAPKTMLPLTCMSLLKGGQVVMTTNNMRDLDYPSCFDVDVHTDANAMSIVSHHEQRIEPHQSNDIIVLEASLLRSAIRYIFDADVAYQVQRGVFVPLKHPP